MSPHPFTNFEIQKCYENQLILNSVYSRIDLSKIKDRAYIINLDECESIGTHLIALYVIDNNVIYFDSFVVERIQKKFKNSQKQKYCNKYLQSTSARFNNVCIRLYWIY